MRGTLFAFALLALAACNAPPPAAPEEAAAPPAVELITGAPVTTGGLTLSQGWVREPPNGAPTAAGFVTIENQGGAQDALIGVSSPRAGRMELHEMSMDGGMMTMRHRDSIVIMPKEKAVLAPGGMHLMFFDMPEPLKAGEQVEVTFKFAKHGDVTYVLPVNPPDAAPAEH